jgi:hypothetical protein
MNQIACQFNMGDRVLMLKHADWKEDAAGTVRSSGRIRRNSFGEQYVDHWIEFDAPQADLTDEIHGNFDRRYASSTVAQQFLQVLDSPSPPI